jgi:hypothetical protein
VEPDLTIVGAGLTGLTAAIEAAERGWHVVVAEAYSQPGGRARSLPAPFRANTGPHAIYIDGPWWAWLERRGLTPPIVKTPPGASLVMAGGQLGPWPAELSEAIAALPAGAPVQESFRSWLLRHVGTCAAEAIIGVVFIPTFDHDPGRLSAEFARERLRRALAGGARYVAGGWSTLAGLLARRAASLGAQIRTQARVSAVPAGPAILATSLATARQLTGDRSLTWPSARVATFDLGLRADGGPGWFRVMDLDDRIYAARYSLADPTLAPPGHELIQITAACSPRERKPTPNAGCTVFSTRPGPAGALRCDGSEAACAHTAPEPSTCPGQHGATARPSTAATPSRSPQTSPPHPGCWPRPQSPPRNSPSSNSAKPRWRPKPARKPAAGIGVPAGQRPQRRSGQPLWPVGP